MFIVRKCLELLNNYLGEQESDEGLSPTEWLVGGLKLNSVFKDGGGGVRN